MWTCTKCWNHTLSTFFQISPTNVTHLSLNPCGKQTLARNLILHFCVTNNFPIPPLFSWVSPWLKLLFTVTAWTAEDLNQFYSCMTVPLLAVFKARISSLNGKKLEAFLRSDNWDINVCKKLQENVKRRSENRFLCFTASSFIWENSSSPR